MASKSHPTKIGDFTPGGFAAGLDKMVWWKSEKGHEWQSNIVKEKSPS
ncbi:zinc-ribbon domain-containing protein [Neobacillus drentensis]